MWKGCYKAVTIPDTGKIFKWFSLNKKFGNTELRL